MAPCSSICERRPLAIQAFPITKYKAHDEPSAALAIDRPLTRRDNVSRYPTDEPSSRWRKLAAFFRCGVCKIEQPAKLEACKVVRTAIEHSGGDTRVYSGFWRPDTSSFRECAVCHCHHLGGTQMENMD